MLLTIVGCTLLLTAVIVVMQLKYIDEITSIPERA